MFPGLHVALMIGSVLGKAAFVAATNPSTDQAPWQQLCELCKAMVAEQDISNGDFADLGCLGRTWDSSFLQTCSKYAVNLLKTLKPLVSDDAWDELRSLLILLEEQHQGVKDGYAFMKRTGIDPMYGVVVG